MKQILKSIFTLCLLFVGVGSVMAENAVLNPTFDACYRPKGDCSGWDKLALSSGDGNTSFEIRWSSRLFAIQEYEIPNFANATSLSLRLVRDNGMNNNPLVGLWLYPYTDPLPTASGTKPNVNNFTANVLATLGVTALGGADGTPTSPLVSTNIDKTGSTSFTIDASKLESITPVSYKKDTAIVRFLISTIQNGGTNTKYYSANSANGDKRPTLTVTYDEVTYPVLNVTSGSGYSNLSSAISEASADDVLEVNEDQEVSARLNVGVSLTIQAGKDKDVSIKRKLGYTNGLIFLPSANGVTLTIQGGEGTMTLDGKEISATSNFIEASTNTRTVVLKDVTIKNCKTSSNQGAISNKNNGALTLNNVDFVNCTTTNASGSGALFIGSGKVSMTGNISFTGCTRDIYIENYSFDANGVAATSPISITTNNTTVNRTVVKNCTDASKFVLTNAGYKLVSDGTNLVIAENPFNLNVTNLGWASMYLDFAATVPTGATAYYASSATASSIALTAIEAGSVIPANTGVIVKAATGEYNFAISAETPVDVTGNLFAGVTVDTSCEANSVYVLSGESTQAKPIFGRFTGTTLGAYKAYLPSDKVPASAKGTVEFTFEGTPTGIMNLTPALNQGEVINLQGIKVNKNYKGVVIKNGKKYLNK